MTDFIPDCYDPLFDLANRGWISTAVYRTVVMAVPVPTYSVLCAPASEVVSRVVA